MMQMLGFRGGSASKERDHSPMAASPSNPNLDNSSPGSGFGSSSSSSVEVNGVVGAPRPLRLVYCDEKGKFQMDPEAVKALQLVKGPLGVVSVCGRARQGKSFILNQLLGRSSGFQVASTHRPCTKGLWMWSAPLKRTALDGTEYNLLLLDSEGIDAYDQTGTYSIQIFSLAVLLSSMFIYNQMGGIDEAALDRLSLVTEMTKHIRVRASGGRSTVSELGQFSPVFVWLLRDFYLDLVENNQKISPRDYLELALRPVQGGGKDNVTAKNEIRESIRALFPDRECFALVRPLNNESDLRRLDQLPLDRLRPEFRSSLDELTRYVFGRTRPKQVGSTVMTGPVLAAITQSFLDALNSGAVPTISSSWQSVEEAECRRAYDSAAETYMSSFDRTRPAEEVALREAHEDAVQKSLAAYNASAVGTGSARLTYEKLLQTFVRKAFEDYKRNVFLEADLQCSNIIQSMEKKLRAACQVPDVKYDTVIQELETLISEYESSCHAPGKWKKLAVFLQQCLEGPILDLFKKQLGQVKLERRSLLLKCQSTEEKFIMLEKQLEASEKHSNDNLKRYEDAIGDKQRLSKEYSNHVSNLKSNYSTLEERHQSTLKALENVQAESSYWKQKYEQRSSEKKNEEEKLYSEAAALKTRIDAAEGKLSAAREQVKSANEEASEWKRKYDVTVRETKSALERAALAQERTNHKTQEREDALRVEFTSLLENKEEEIKHMAVKIENSENRMNNLMRELKAAEFKLESYDIEVTGLKDEIKVLNEMLNPLKTKVQSHKEEMTILEQDRDFLQEKLISECKKYDEADQRLRDAEREAKRATELADAARAEAAAAQREKSEAQQLAVERLATIERTERRVDSLERERHTLQKEIERLLKAEMDAMSKVAELELKVGDRQREITDMLNQNNEQRSGTVQVLESLLETERTARNEANRRAEALSLQLQATQGKLDTLQQQLTSVRLNETALDGKLKMTHGKRSRVDDLIATGSVQDMDVDQVVKGKKRSKSTTSPSKHNQTEDGDSVIREEDDNNQSQEGSEMGSSSYFRFTIPKLKQELTKHGFGAQLLQLKNPIKKDILALYEKLVLEK